MAGGQQWIGNGTRRAIACDAITVMPPWTNRRLSNGQPSTTSSACAPTDVANTWRTWPPSATNAATVSASPLRATCCAFCASITCGLGGEKCSSSGGLRG